MRLAVLLALLGVLVAAPPATEAATRAPTIAMSIIHVFRGCHVWTVGSRSVGPVTTIRTKPGARIKLRMTCPMDFDVRQTAGPKLALGSPRFIAGTTRTIVFRKPGIYRLVAKNAQTSDELGLETLGEDNLLRLTVRVG